MSRAKPSYFGLACVSFVFAAFNLETLSLYNTNTTDTGVAELKKGLPNCQISR